MRVCDIFSLNTHSFSEASLRRCGCISPWNCRCCKHITILGMWKTNNPNLTTFDSKQRVWKLDTSRAYYNLGRVTSSAKHEVILYMDPRGGVWVTWNVEYVFVDPKGWTWSTRDPTGSNWWCCWEKQKLSLSDYIKQTHLLGGDESMAKRCCERFHIYCEECLGFLRWNYNRVSVFGDTVTIPKTVLFRAVMRNDKKTAVLLLALRKFGRGRSAWFTIQKELCEMIVRTLVETHKQFFRMFDEYNEEDQSRVESSEDEIFDDDPIAQERFHRYGYYYPEDRKHC